MRAHSFFIAALAFAFGVSAYAGELDNESSVTNEQIQLGQELPATVVVRIKASTEEVEVLHSQETLVPSEAASAFLAGSEFTKMNVKDQAQGPVAGELDQDSSRSSWYFGFYNWNCYYPSYYYYGYAYNYRPYYSYYWGGYNYYWYRWGYRY